MYRALNLNTGQMVAVKRIGLDGLKEDEISQLKALCAFKDGDIRSAKKSVASLSKEVEDLKDRVRFTTRCPGRSLD